MKPRNYPILTALLAILAGALHLYGQGTAFTYQGRLLDNGQPANGSYDLTFTAFNASTGGPANGALTNTGVAVSGGLFTTVLDFGGVPDGHPFWFQLGVRTNGGGTFTTVSPRQAVTPTPYALFANTASNLAGSLPVAQLSGTVPLAQLPAEVVTNGADLALRNGPNAFTAPNQFSDVVLATNANNVFRGSFTGNGAGVTNLPPSSINGVLSVVQGGTGGSTASGARSALSAAGSGANADITSLFGLSTPLTVSQGGTAAGTAAEALVNLGAASLTAPNVFTGVNVLTNVNNVLGGTFTGNVSGNGAALTNIPASAVALAPPGMVLIPAGAFTMGDTLDGLSDAHPTNVTVSAFYMDVNLVSWSQWQSVYYWATNHGYAFIYSGAGKAANHPVQTVDWWDCMKWCNARSQQAGKPPVYYTDAGWAQVYTNGEPTTLYPNWAASGYRLPTEAEWEKAARGGLSGQRFPWGNVINQNLANYYGASASFTYDLGPTGFNVAFTNGGYPYTSPVGSFAANGYGLNDMAGNVSQWCWDWYALYAGGIDPRGPAGPLSYRVLRGGSWGSIDAYYAQCAFRSLYTPGVNNDYIGFRCVRGF